MKITNLSERIQARDGVAVVLYSKPDCQPCKRTKKILDASSVYYTEVDVTTDPVALDYVKNTLGYGGAPVVYVSTLDGDVHWYGLRVDLIKQHITEHQEAAA